MLGLALWLSEAMRAPVGKFHTTAVLKIEYIVRTMVHAANEPIVGEVGTYSTTGVASSATWLTREKNKYMMHMCIGCVQIS